MDVMAYVCDGPHQPYPTAQGYDARPRCDSPVQYQDLAGATACKMCPHNTHRRTFNEEHDPNDRKSSCHCNKEYYWDKNQFPHLDANDWQCTKCPEGGICLGVISNVTSNKSLQIIDRKISLGQPWIDAPPYADVGFFMLKAVAHRTEAFPCEDGACRGGWSSSEGISQCEDGYEGRLCSSCKQDYYKLSGACERCPMTVVLILMLSGIWGSWLLVNLVLSEHMDTIDAMLSFAQIASIIADFEFNWPDSLSVPFTIIGYLDFGTIKTC